MNQQLFWYRNLRIVLSFFLIIVMVVAGIIMMSFLGERKDPSNACYDRLLRFHIRANSDSEKDQAVKGKVKEEVLAYLKPYLACASSKEESKAVISDHFQEIKQKAEETLLRNGFSEKVNVYFSKEAFPVKKYGEFTFPAGRYEALRIDIGEAKGHNWWCMMYPALCFVEESYAYVPQ